MASFKRFGVWADWDHPYLILDPEYEVAAQMVFKWYRGRKPVHWGPSCTALVEADLEYDEAHVSTIMYATIKILTTPTKGGLLDDFLPNLSLAIWTTTSWTTPANADTSSLLIYIYIFSVNSSHK